MNWNFIDQTTTQEWIQALCLTLAHSLWQGLLAAIAAGGILLFTRKSKPALRYNLLASVMLLFVATVALTFIWTMSKSSPVDGSAAIFSKQWVLNTVSSQAGDTISEASKADWLTQVTSFLSQYAQLIVTIWFMVFVLKSLQAASGLHYLKRVTRAVSTPDMHWVVRFHELAERMRIGQEIMLRESGQVTVPMVVGFLKPIVLVPLGMLANLPAAQVEAILLHELAHIRRRDYLVNLVQIFCENVFFFNPAILWISKLIREEREHCCDDLAISVMQNKTSFIHALVSFQEYNQSRPVFEMAFSKKRNHLLDRIKRIINNNNKPLDAMEKLFVTLSLAAAVTLSAAFSPEKPLKPKPPVAPPAPATIENVVVPDPPAAPEAPAPLSWSDTLRKGNSKTEIHSANIYSDREGISTYEVTHNGKKYEIVSRNGKMISLWIDKKEIPKDDFAKYQSEIDELMKEIEEAHDRAEKERGKAEQARQLADMQREQADKQRQEADKHREAADKMRQDAEKQREQADRHREAADKMRQEAEVQRGKAEQQREVAEKQREAYVKVEEGIIEELTRTGLITGRNDLSYKLSDEELIVNGKKQPAELHQKLKYKYKKELGDKKFEMMYNYQNQTGYIKTGLARPTEE